VVLFGSNVASYKFALAEALLSQSSRSSDLLKLDELAVPFAEAICRHLAHSPVQGTSPSSKYLDACRRFVRGKISEDQLRDATVKLAFGDVIDAFHNVGGSPVPFRFFADERIANGGIRLTEDLFCLAKSPQRDNLSYEVEARWRLVETAWSLGLHRKLITVGDQSVDPALFATVQDQRVPVTHARYALSGYQKGKCFYCGGAITVDSGSQNRADVDHVLPHSLMSRGVPLHLDGVWNLVLACKDCNRGPTGKWARLPTEEYIENLATRNDYYVSSHHPLRETIMSQTGKTDSERKSFLRDAYQEAAGCLVHTWRPSSRGDLTL
jgi:5-methylcytosine-specific restriction endonuclease McrA